MGFFFRKQDSRVPKKSWQGKDFKMRSSILKKRRPEKKRKFSRFLFWVLLLGFSGVSLYLLFFSPFLEVESISVEGNEDVPASEISGQIEKSLDGKYFRFLSRKNYFLIRTGDIERALAGSGKLLELESIRKNFPNSLTVRVVERKALLVWCSGGVCYFADSDGFVFGGVPELEEEIEEQNFLVVVDDSARPIEIGKTKINLAYLENLSNLAYILKSDFNLAGSEYFHTPGMASQEINLKTTEGWVLKASLAGPAEETKKIMETLFEKDLNEEARKKLDYLDLRVKNKIYYKTK